MSLNKKIIEHREVIAKLNFIMQTQKHISVNLIIEVIYGVIDLLLLEAQRCFEAKRAYSGCHKKLFC
jgi:hypothetical protein